MKIQIIITALILLFVLSDCDSEQGQTWDNKPLTTSSNSPKSSNNSDSTKQKSRADAPPPLPNAHQCLLKGSMLEENSHWIKSAQTLLGIVANETTEDIDFGESHRVFTAVNTADCSIILQKTLPVNGSPDFPWYLNVNTYEPTNEVLCMQGVEFVYCYDVAQEKLLTQMKPEFLNKRVALDAQSGTPVGLEIWNHYLLGYALDLGASAFDLRKKNEVSPILPRAEYYSENDESFHSLFLLEDEKGLLQALMPTLNEDQDGMIVNKIFETPLALNVKIKDSVRDNRFIILNHKEDKGKIAIDMEKMISVTLAGDLATKSTKEILNWLKR